MNTGLLSCTDAYRLTVLNIADGIRLGVFQSYHCDGKVADRLGRKLPVLSHDIREHIGAYFELVASLLEGNAVHVLMLDGSGLV